MDTQLQLSQKNKTKDMAMIALFTVVMAMSAWICIPTMVPVTMQTFAVFLSLSLLGGRRGTITICLYLLLGIIGIPVFSGGRAGIGILLGSTGGYMLGWIVAGCIMWLLESIFGRKQKVLAAAMVLGLLACYAFGTAWFLIVYTQTTGRIGLWTALCWCVFPFVIPDIIKIAAAWMVQKRLKVLV